MIFFFVGPCVNYSGCQITWAKFCKVRAHRTFRFGRPPCRRVASICVPPSLFRKTWLAKASLSGCGWTTSSTWWRNTSWHCGMKGERSPLAYCQLCLTGVLASSQLAASWVVNRPPIFKSCIYLCDFPLPFTGISWVSSAKRGRGRFLVPNLQELSCCASARAARKGALHLHGWRKTSAVSLKKTLSIT